MLALDCGCRCKVSKPTRHRRLLGLDLHTIARVCAACLVRAKRKLLRTQAADVSNFAHPSTMWDPRSPHRRSSTPDMHQNAVAAAAAVVVTTPARLSPSSSASRTRPRVITPDHFVSILVTAASRCRQIIRLPSTPLCSTSLLRFAYSLHTRPLVVSAERVKVGRDVRLTSATMSSPNALAWEDGRDKIRRCTCLHQEGRANGQQSRSKSSIKPRVLAVVLTRAVADVSRCKWPRTSSIEARGRHMSCALGSEQTVHTTPIKSEHKQT